jgi:hypothetical protein
MKLALGVEGLLYAPMQYILATINFNNLDLDFYIYFAAFIKVI